MKSQGFTKSPTTTSTSAFNDASAKENKAAEKL